MHALIARLSLALLVVGCNSGVHGGSTGHASMTEDHGSTAPASDASTTHEHPATTTGESGHEHASETGHEHTGETGHEHTSETGHAHTTGATTGEPGSPSAAYCECMLVHCHDQYHGTWGEDHETSVAMCEAEAAGLPSVGEPAMTGDSLECRIHHCELARTDPAACASAIGGGACV